MSNDCCNGDIPVIDEIVHMIASEWSVACGVKLDDGKIHLIVSDIDEVSCGDCRIKWLLFVSDERQATILELERQAASREAMIRDLQRELSNQSRTLTRVTTERNIARADRAYWRDVAGY
jgi:hypothetical protein